MFTFRFQNPITNFSYCQIRFQNHVYFMASAFYIYFSDYYKLWWQIWHVYFAIFRMWCMLVLIYGEKEIGTKSIKRYLTTFTTYIYFANKLNLVFIHNLDRSEIGYFWRKTTQKYNFSKVKFVKVVNQIWCKCQHF